jgi:hypothetical protein
MREELAVLDRGPVSREIRTRQVYLISCCRGSMLGTIRSHGSLIAGGRIGMLITLRTEDLSVSANEGMVLIDGPGLAVTLDIEAASALSDQLLAGCTLARQQQRAAIGQVAHSESSPLG